LAASSLAAANGTLGLPAVAPSTNPASASAISLGKALFFDSRFSGDGTISCASCHDPQKAFSDGLTVARGLHGLSGTRKTPSLWNVAFASSEFWDGRRTSLEQQATDPLLNPREHGLLDGDAALGIVRADMDYAAAFARTFSVTPDHITLDLVAKALASFERTLIAGDAPFDRYLYGADRRALSAAAVKGLELFRGRAGCASCHMIGDKSALFTDNMYHRVGVDVTPTASALATAATRVIAATPAELDHLISDDAEIAALGRFVVTKNPKDIGSFKTPSLRNVVLLAPYMHDGSVKTLPEAVDVEIYYRSLESGRPLILTPLEKKELIAFLESLTSPTVVTYARSSPSMEPSGTAPPTPTSQR
jgi:cytochrome c peroxidase